MRTVVFGNFIVTAIAITFASLSSIPALAEVQYGPWQKTSDCRTARMPVGPGRGQVELPRTPGTEQAMECKWLRIVNDCPNLRDKLRHPIRCVTKKQISDYSQWEPRA